MTPSLPVPQNNIEVSRSGIARYAFFFDSTKAHSASVRADAIQLQFGSRSATIRYFDIDAIDVKAGWFWSSVELKSNYRTVSVAWLDHHQATSFTVAAAQARENWWHALLAREGQEIRPIAVEIESLNDPTRYLSDHIFKTLTERAQRLSRLLPNSWPVSLSAHKTVKQIAAIREFLRQTDVKTRANQVYVAQELIRSRDFFDTVETKPLTYEQRRAVVVDEDRNLVVAAAGSGKTSVIVAKAGWLIKRGYRRPSEILLLAYAKDAQQEMEGRLKRRLNETQADGLTVKTFHSLGLSIIGEMEGTRPSLAKVADDSKALAALLKSITVELLNDPVFSKTMIAWFQTFFAPYKSIFDFVNYGQYWRYVRQYEIRSLKGDLVKSYEECEIANFLYLNGIPYEYECAYEYETATNERRQYQPDFYLTDAKIYIEHFALSASGKTPPFINEAEYKSSIEWKREIHKKYKTKLIETYSHEKASGVLLEQLASKLEAHGVTFAPVSSDSMFSALEQQGRVDPFTSLVSTFLQHFKGNQYSLADIEDRAIKSPDRQRARAFVEVFGAIYGRYQAWLQDLRQIDFHDMISIATNHVESDQYKNRYGYILVDEFQDISLGRARLLKALLKKSSENQLFAVGDDWQAIYRFAGSDIAIMRDFQNEFGASERIDLTTTFRCVDKISGAASQFVLQNPAQIQKSVNSVSSGAEPRIHIGLPDDDDADLLRLALDRIAAKAGAAKSVLLLGRYRHLEPDNLAQLSRLYPGLRIKYKTAHGSKGLEADYVVVLGLCAGRLGFPAEIVDDPLLDLVLAAPEAHPNAEERRLFYVALTRAREEVYLLAEGGPPSRFINELIDDGYEVTVFGRPIEHDVACPKCIEGRLERKDGRHSVFYGCTNWPYCDHKQPACPNCNTGLPVKKDGQMRCMSCQAETPPCPRCDGWLRLKAGKHGQFFGCVNYPVCNFTKNYTPAQPQ